jgi:hypothetical protein
MDVDSIKHVQVTLSLDGDFQAIVD